MRSRPAWEPVRDLNLKSYASSERKCYGSCQRVLEQVSASKRHRRLVDAFRPKPPRMISAEQASEHSGAFRASDAKDYWVTFEQRVSVVS